MANEKGREKDEKKQVRETRPNKQTKNEEMRGKKRLDRYKNER